MKGGLVLSGFLLGLMTAVYAVCVNVPSVVIGFGFALAVGSSMFIGALLLSLVLKHAPKETIARCPLVVRISHVFEAWEMVGDGRNDRGGGSGGGKNAIEHTEANTAKKGGLFCDGSSVCKKSDAFSVLVKREARDLVNEISSTVSLAVDKLAYAMFGGMTQDHNTYAFAKATQEGGAFGRTGGAWGCTGGAWG